MSSIKQIVREPDIFLFPAWNEHISYYENSIVTFFDSENNRNFIYMALAPIEVGDKPNRDSNSWVEISYDSDHLTARVEHLWNQNYTTLKAQVDSDLNTISEIVYSNVDSELRETRYEVNYSLVNFLEQSKRDLDSDLVVFKKDVDSDNGVQTFALTELNSLLKVDVDSDLLVLRSADSDNTSYLNFRIDQLQSEKDSDITVANGYISSLLSFQTTNLATTTKRFSGIDSDIAKIYAFNNNHISNTLASFDARIDQTADEMVELNTYVGDFVRTISNNEATHTKIYRDIQSNRDRIIVLEDQIAGSIMDVVESNAAINRGYDSDIQSFVVKLNEQNSNDLSLYNDMSDLRTTVDKLKAYSGFDSDADLVDSDWVLRQIAAEADKDKVDSDWVMRQIPYVVDSDWILKQIPTQVDSDWIVNNTINIKNDSDALTVINIVKTNLDMGTF